VTDPLSGCWAKLERAESHIRALNASIVEVSGDDLKSVPLGRKYEPEHGAVVYRVERAPQIRESWGLLIGDALHNLRGGLDHLWWQLATSNLGREPTEEEAKDVQFPIFSKPEMWAGHRFLKYVDPKLANKIEPLQPYNAPAGEVYALGALGVLSNIDKHRILHAVARPAAEGTFQMYPGPDDFHNCALTPGRNIELNTLGNRPLKRGDEVFRVYVTPTGPNCDVDLNANLTAHIAFHGNWDLPQSLNAMWNEVRGILTLFAPYFEGPSIGHA
jgi:hypothetical protein